MCAMWRMVVLLLLFLVTNVHAQINTVIEMPVSINEAGAAPEASAVLDINSTTQGILIPRMTTSQRLAIENPACGLMVYDVTEQSFFYRTETEWMDLRGMQGEMGAQGPIGAQGATGPQGLTGPQGDTGAQGPQGLTGPHGPVGPQGDKGVTGAQGPVGNTGATGNTGAQGPAGPQGETGAIGAQGPAGNTGATGNTGAQGPAGPQGATGATGAQGPQGATGAQGPAGATGAAGVDGINCWDLNNNGMTDPEEDINGDGIVSVLDCRGFNGTDGAQGPQGPAGPQGDTGEQGPQGETGPEGPQGDPGEPASLEEIMISRTGDTLFISDEIFIIIPGLSEANANLFCPEEEFIGQAVVTSASGSFGNVAVAGILDIRSPDQATLGDDWANPTTVGANVLSITNPTTWTYEELGQIYGISVGNSDGNIFFGASNVYAYDGDLFTPAAVGSGGEQGLYTTNFSNPAAINSLVTTSNNFIADPVGGSVVPGRFLDTNLADNPLPTGWGNIAYDELTNTLYGSNLSDGRIYAIDATTGVIRQVIDPFPAGGAGFLSDPYPADQVVWAIELNDCTRQIFFIQQNVAGGGDNLSDGGPNRTKSLYTLDIDNTNGTLINQQLIQTINLGTREKIVDIDFNSDCTLMLLGERGRIYNSGTYLFEKSSTGNTFEFLTSVTVGSNDSGDPWEFGLNSAGGVSFGSDESESESCDQLIWSMADCLDPPLVPGDCNSFGPQGVFLPLDDVTQLSGDLRSTSISVDITPNFDLDPRFSSWSLGDIEIFSCCFDR